MIIQCPNAQTKVLGVKLGNSQNHHAVAGGCAALFDWSLRRTHPLPRGGSDCIQVWLVLSELEAAYCVFADAAEVESAVVFDRVGDLGVAVGRAVLKVFDYFAL